MATFLRLLGRDEATGVIERRLLNLDRVAEAVYSPAVLDYSRSMLTLLSSLRESAARVVLYGAEADAAAHALGLVDLPVAASLGMTAQVVFKGDFHEHYGICGPRGEIGRREDSPSRTFSHE